MLFKLGNVNKSRIDLFFKLIKSFVKDKNINNVVEVGVGSGELSYRMINELELDVTMVDIKDQREHQKQTHFLCVDCSMEPIGVEDASIDLVIATQVIEHLENLTYFINEVNRILKKNGYLLISYPNYSNIYQRFLFLLRGNVSRLGGKINTGGHINFLPEKALIYFLSDKFEVSFVEGDAIVLTGRMPGIFSLLDKRFKNKHIIFPSIKTTLLSYNVNVLLRKKE